MGGIRGDFRVRFQDMGRTLERIIAAEATVSDFAEAIFEMVYREDPEHACTVLLRRQNRLRQFLVVPPGWDPDLFLSTNSDLIDGTTEMIAPVQTGQVVIIAHDYAGDPLTWKIEVLGASVQDPRLDPDFLPPR